MAEWTIGQTILNEYAIERELGRGGMGRVWLVKSQSTGRCFAVKQTLLKDAEHRKAFLAELQTWIDLPEHPNIVPCRFFRTVGDEIVIFADFIEGGSLADWIAKRKLTTVEQILDVAIQFAWGLHAIHERGLIHQDVKPGNVLMTADGIPMVADFGLARARLRAADGAFLSPALPPGQQSVLISAGGMTPAYASPEQRAGQPLSRKTDIWSWGVSVLDMFMGGASCPHGGQIAAEVLEDFVANGGKADGLPEMPDIMVGILAKCFVNPPTLRWEDIAKTAHRLQIIYESVAKQTYRRLAPAHPSNTPSATWLSGQTGGVKWQDPRLFLKLFCSTKGYQPDDTQSSSAISPQGRAIADLALYEQATHYFPATSPMPTDISPEIHASLYVNKALVHEQLSDNTGALCNYNAAINILDQWSPQSEVAEVNKSLQLAHALDSKGCVLQVTGRLDDAKATLRKALSILNVFPSHTTFRISQLVTTHQHMAIVLEHHHDPAAAEHEYQEAISVLSKSADALDKHDLASLYHSTAVFYHNNGHSNNAIRYLSLAQHNWQMLLTVQPKHESRLPLAISFTTMGDVYSKEREWRNSLAAYNTAITMLEQLRPASETNCDPYLSKAYVNTRQ